MSETKTLVLDKTPERVFVGNWANRRCSKYMSKFHRIAFRLLIYFFYHIMKDYSWPTYKIKNLFYIVHPIIFCVQEFPDTLHRQHPSTQCPIPNNPLQFPKILIILSFFTFKFFFCSNPTASDS